MAFDAFWSEHFKDELAAGLSEADILASEDRKEVYIWDEEGQPPVDLSLCARMPRLRDLVVHAREVHGKDALPRIDLLRDLVISGKGFTPADFATIAQCASLADLSVCLMDVASLADFATAKLTRLGLSQVTGLTGTEVAGLDRLTQLRIDRTDLGDFAPLGGLPRLRKLEVHQTPLNDLRCLAAKNLEEFEYDSLATSDDGIELVEGRAKLKRVIYPITGISILAGCEKLRAFGVNALSRPDFTPLAHLPVTYLDIRFSASDEHLQQIMAQAEETWGRPLSFAMGEEWREPAKAGLMREAARRAGVAPPHAPSRAVAEEAPSQEKGLFRRLFGS